MNSAIIDERLQYLFGGRKLWWDVTEQHMVASATAYVPFGCPDWGETAGMRNVLCQFCGLPNSVKQFREAFYGGHEVPDKDLVGLFSKTLANIASEGEFHTLMIFNAGSFTAMPPSVQQQLVCEVVRYPFIKRVVVESRAMLITYAALSPLVELLNAPAVRLTVRVGVETKDDHLRLKVLKKGHSRKQLMRAAEVMRSLGVTSGGYVLLNPAPGLDARWAKEESLATISWVLGSELDMDEVYLGPTCVSPGTTIAALWQRGEFKPPSLWSVYSVLSTSAQKYPGQVHLLRFVDEPPFLAVPSNHTSAGIPESLEGASGCDREFHKMFDLYRRTMEASSLYEVACECRSMHIG